jgi:hypothetical protein
VEVKKTSKIVTFEYPTNRGSKVVKVVMNTATPRISAYAIKYHPVEYEPSSLFLSDIKTYVERAKSLLNLG